MSPSDKNPKIIRIYHNPHSSFPYTLVYNNRSFVRLDESGVFQTIELFRLELHSNASVQLTLGSEIYMSHVPPHILNKTLNPKMLMISLPAPRLREFEENRPASTQSKNSSQKQAIPYLALLNGMLLYFQFGKL